MTREKLDRGKKVHMFTLLLVVAVAWIVIQKYYNKVITEGDRLEAKRIKQAVEIVIAKTVGSDLTYDNGRIYWTRENAMIIKQGIVNYLALDEMVIPIPREKGYYYYMYLASPYTVVKLPYKTKNDPQIDLDIVTQEYIAKSYPKKEYAQVDDKVPKFREGYEFVRELCPAKDMIVCLNI